MTMRERVARAICWAQLPPDGQSRFAEHKEEMLDSMWRQYEPHATAALQAMLHPTREMLFVGDDAVWRAMLQEAMVTYDQS